MPTALQRLSRPLLVLPSGDFGALGHLQRVVTSLDRRNKKLVSGLAAPQVLILDGLPSRLASCLGSISDMMEHLFVTVLSPRCPICVEHVEESNLQNILLKVHLVI